MDLKYYIDKLHDYSTFFMKNRMITDIYTNSKIFEVVMAEQLNHTIINGHSHTPDATDSSGLIYEYKHYKITSTNHTWTFNDVSIATISKLSEIDYVVFAEIDNTTIVPCISKMYMVPSKTVQDYLSKKMQFITNTRAMINISSHQIEKDMQAYPAVIPPCSFSNELKEVFETANVVENLTGIPDILTSNKLWELLVGMKLHHKINPEQNRHDARDQDGQTYEYKVYTKPSWSFQDISNKVLDGYLNDKAIILAVVDKSNFDVTSIYSCNPNAIVDILKTKLQRRTQKSPSTRRLIACINKSDLGRLLNNNNAKRVL